MNWDTAWLTTKVTLFVILDILLTIGSVACAVLVGSLIMIILEGGVLGVVAGALASAVTYFAGISGRNLALSTTLARLLFSDDERAAIRVIGAEQQKKKEDEGNDE